MACCCIMWTLKDDVSSVVEKHADPQKKETLPENSCQAKACRIAKRVFSSLCPFSSFKRSEQNFSQNKAQSVFPSLYGR